MDRPSPRSWASVLAYLPALGLTLLVALGLVLGPAQGATPLTAPAPSRTPSRPRRPAGPRVGARPTPRSTSTASTVTVDGDEADADRRAGRHRRHRPAHDRARDRHQQVDEGRAVRRRPGRGHASSSTPSPTTSSSASSPSTPTSRRPCPPPRTGPRRSTVVDGLELSKKTRLYDGVVQAVDVVGDRGPAQRAGALRRRRHQRAPRSTTVTAGDRGRPRCRVDVVALDQDGEALTALQTAGRRRRGEVIPSDPRGPRRRRSPTRRPSWPRQVLVTVQVPPLGRAHRGDAQGHPADRRRAR